MDSTILGDPRTQRTSFADLRAFAVLCELFAGVLRVIPGRENVKRDQFCNLTNI